MKNIIKYIGRFINALVTNIYTYSNTLKKHILKLKYILYSRVGRFQHFANLDMFAPSLDSLRSKKDNFKQKLFGSKKHPRRISYLKKSKRSKRVNSKEKLPIIHF